jgi:hypothetical protein
MERLSFQECMPVVGMRPEHAPSTTHRRAIALCERLLSTKAYPGRGGGWAQVFPWPEHREFFFKCGFRLSHRFIMMKYMRGAEDAAKPVELRDTLGVVLATNGVSTLLDDVPLSLFETSNPPTLEEKGAATRS